MFFLAGGKGVPSGFRGLWRHVGHPEAGQASGGLPAMAAFVAVHEGRIRPGVGRRHRSGDRPAGQGQAEDRPRPGRRIGRRSRQGRPDAGVGLMVAGHGCERVNKY
ncbi:hypothetical protein MTBSS4_80014 [Magnetospirillum sp. SS-4]|nr:hypothetical protein MTBSS4_80014 [Magnetospirillum sp. SS-4]